MSTPGRPMSAAPRVTDWDAYYRKPFVATSVTRRITGRRVLHHLSRHLPTSLRASGAHIVEWGGANSCFMDTIRTAMRPATYTVYDTNELGLSLLRERAGGDTTVCAQVRDALARESFIGEGADLVYSVGLIEHFDASGTARAIENHFACARPGGLVLITFPTPTWLYRTARVGAELVRRWPFHDERPLSFEEVQAQMGRWGEPLAVDLIWPIVFTQGLCLYRRRSLDDAGQAGIKRTT